MLKAVVSPSGFESHQHMSGRQYAALHGGWDEIIDNSKADKARPPPAVLFRNVKNRSWE